MNRENEDSFRGGKPMNSLRQSAVRNAKTPKRGLLPAVLAALALSFVSTPPAHAGKMSVLEGLLRTAVEESQAELKGGVKLASEARLLRGSEEVFEAGARRHETLLRAAGRLVELDEAAVAKRLAKLTVRTDSETARTLASMSVAERHFVVEAAESAGKLA